MKKIDDETLDYVEILAKLDLSEDERIKAKDDMEKMLAFIEKMNEHMSEWHDKKNKAVEE